MPSPLGTLLTSRRFAPLFVTQFLGAFNDNLLKSALGIYVTYSLAAQSGADPGTLVMLTGAIFIAPFFLFSGASGTFADRTDKAAIARWVKIVEIGIMAAGAAGLYFSSLPALLVAVFALGTHSTVFGPIKYALLPQHLHDDELVAGNALIEAGTFLSILSGRSSAAGRAPDARCAGHRRDRRRRAALGWLAARLIPPAPPTLAADAPRPRLLADSLSVVRHVTREPRAVRADPRHLVVLAVRRDHRVGPARLRQGRPLRRRARRDADAGAVRARRRPRLAPRGAPAPRRSQRTPRAARRHHHGRRGHRPRPREPGARRGRRAGRHLRLRRRAGELAPARRPGRSSRWAAASSPCRSTPCSSTRASRRIAPGSSPATTSSTPSS